MQCLLIDWMVRRAIALPPSGLRSALFAPGVALTAIARVAMVTDWNANTEQAIRDGRVARANPMPKHARFHPRHRFLGTDWLPMKKCRQGQHSLKETPGSSRV